MCVEAFGSECLALSFLRQPSRLALSGDAKHVTDGLVAMVSKETLEEYMKEKHSPPGPHTRPEDLNKNSEQFWKSRGYPRRPDDWEKRDPSEPPPVPAVPPPQQKK